MYMQRAREGQRRVVLVLGHAEHQIMRHRAVSTSATNSEVVTKALRHLAVCAPSGENAMSRPRPRRVDLWEDHAGGLYLLLDGRDAWMLHDVQMDGAVPFVADAAAILAGRWTPCAEDGQREVDEAEWDNYPGFPFQHLATYTDKGVIICNDAEFASAPGQHYLREIGPAEEVTEVTEREVRS